MKKIDFTLKNILWRILGSLFLVFNLFINQGCALIVGGSNYRANIVVENHPNAAIKYDGLIRGYGNTIIKVPRKEADNLVIIVSETGCPTIQRQYNSRIFREWAFLGTLVTWTGLSINGGPWIPIPFGVITDGVTGSWWKPDVKENGITKIDYKNYNYNIIYKECDKSIYQQNSQTESADTLLKKKNIGAEYLNNN